MITYERDPRHVNLLLLDCDCFHGKKQGKTGKTILCMGTNPRSWPFANGQKLQHPMHEKLFHCKGSATRFVHKQSNQQIDDAADDQNGLNAAKARQVVPRKTNAVASTIVRLSNANLAACAVTQKSSICKHLMQSLSHHEKANFTLLCVEHAELWD